MKKLAAVLRCPSPSPSLASHTFLSSASRPADAASPASARASTAVSRASDAVTRAPTAATSAPRSALAAARPASPAALCSAMREPEATCWSASCALKPSPRSVNRVSASAWALSEARSRAEKDCSCSSSRASTAVRYSASFPSAPSCCCCSADSTRCCTAASRSLVVSLMSARLVFAETLRSSRPPWRAARSVWTAALSSVRPTSTAFDVAYRPDSSAAF